MYKLCFHKKTIIENVRVISCFCFSGFLSLLFFNIFCSMLSVLLLFSVRLFCFVMVSYFIFWVTGSLATWSRWYGTLPCSCPRMTFVCPSVSLSLFFFSFKLHSGFVLKFALCIWCFFTPRVHVLVVAFDFIWSEPFL